MGDRMTENVALACGQRGADEFGSTNCMVVGSMVASSLWWTWRRGFDRAAINADEFAPVAVCPHLAVGSSVFAPCRAFQTAS